MTLARDATARLATERASAIREFGRRPHRAHEATSTFLGQDPQSGNGFAGRDL